MVLAHRDYWRCKRMQTSWWQVKPLAARTGGRRSRDVDVPRKNHPALTGIRGGFKVNMATQDLILRLGSPASRYGNLVLVLVLHHREKSTSNAGAPSWTVAC